MGQINSTVNKNESYFIPSERLFKLSYIVARTITTDNEKYQQVDLHGLYEKFDDNIVVFMQFCYQKFQEAGYTLKPINIDWGYSSINEIFYEMESKGFPISNNGLIKDIKFVKNFYKVDLEIIYHFLNRGQPLLAIILLDETFIKDVLKLNEEKYCNKNIITDVLIIVGYDSHNFFIKSNWFKSIIKVENKFIHNIKEIWDIQLLTFY